MMIQPRDPSQLPALRWHFERSGFEVESFDDAIDVHRPDAANENLSSREVMHHLRVWLAMHPDSIAEPAGEP